MTPAKRISLDLNSCGLLYPPDLENLMPHELDPLVMPLMGGFETCLKHEILT